MTTFSVSPTTDLVEVAGVPFTRTGTRQNDFTASITGTLTKTIQLSGSYHFQWVEFDNPDELGIRTAARWPAHSLSRSRAHKAVTSRLRLGGTLRRASAAKAGPASGSRRLTIQDAEATVSYQLGPR